MGSYNQAIKETAMQIIISIFALAAAAYASDPYAPPAPYHPAPAPYHPAPAPYHPAPAPYHEEVPKNYQFGYDVHGYDGYGNPNIHSRTEARDEYKKYHADVKHEGEICPDKSLIKHKDPYHPAPAPYHAPAPAPYHAPVVHAPVVHAPVVHPVAHPVSHHVAHAPVAHVATPFVHHG